MAAGSYEVTQRTAGTNLSVDIAANVGYMGIGAVIEGDSVTGQGPYPVPIHSAVINEAITAAHASNPRVDRIVLEIQDNTHDASGANAVRTRVIDGTATGGATLDNLTGAAAVPSNCLLLADVLVPALDTAISNSQIRDRRKWARGAFVSVFDNGNYTRSSSTNAEISSTIKPRLECSSGVYRVMLNVVVGSAAVDAAVRFCLFVDGTLVAPTVQRYLPTANPADSVSCEWYLTSTQVSAGSHQFAPAWASVNNSTLMTIASTTRAVEFTVEEIVRQNYANNTITTG